jgi:Zn-dependent M28 family amino/carboxypeptidase
MMRLIHSSECKGIAPKLDFSLPDLSESRLRDWVRALSVPRDYRAETVTNENIGSWIAKQFEDFGYHVKIKGPLRNIIALPKEPENVVLVGAHYDSVPQSPGADDNGSAVAAMLACAQGIATSLPQAQVAFVAFNCEETGYEGSRNFVEEFLEQAAFKVRHAHILEMVGYASDQPGTQRIPTALPINLPSAGNFLGLLSDERSGGLMDGILAQARSEFADFPVIGLEVPTGMEKCLPVLARSDHVPFWEHGIPAVMWTDTAEYRNPNYHQPSDTPETLNYPFLRTTAQLLFTVLANTTAP